MNPQDCKLTGTLAQAIPETRRYLTPAQVADLWQMDVSTVYRLAASDPTMPATRIGGSVRFRADRLEAWCEARTQGRERKASRTAQAVPSDTAKSVPDQQSATV
jgi:excisionase family DNA binding protein